MKNSRGISMISLIITIIVTVMLASMALSTGTRYLKDSKKKEQENFIEAMDYAQAVPSLSQAQRIKELSKSGKLTLEKMQNIMSEIKKGEITRVTFTNEQLHKYFPDHYTPQMMKREIIDILKIWRQERWES